MSLLDEGRDLAEKRPKPGGKCSVARLIAGLPTEEAEEVRELIASDLTNSVVAETLQKHHWMIGDYTITRHRARGCQCR